MKDYSLVKDDIIADFLNLDIHVSRFFGNEVWDVRKHDRKIGQGNRYNYVVKGVIKKNVLVFIDVIGFRLALDKRKDNLVLRTVCYVVKV